MNLKINHITVQFLEFLRAIWDNKFLVIQLTKRDFQSRYLGSYLGLPWAFIKPLSLVFVIWFAFTYGLKSGMVDETVPFPLWLVVGFIPWFYASENIAGSIQSLLEYAFLIKNISFRPSIIPLIKILTNSLIHLFFIILLMGVAAAYGYKPSSHWIQIFYYMFCAAMLTLGLSWFASSVQLFFRDIGHIIEIALQLFFWGTPIIWSYKMLPDRFCFMLKLNPFFYLVEGYRDTFIYKIWFFERLWSTLYFWIITSIIFVLGAFVFKKLKPHFADVL